MSRDLLIGAFLAVSVIFGWRAVLAVVAGFVRRRRRIAVGHLLRALEHSLDAGSHISYRRLLSTPRVRGRSYGLVLLKQGPNEPTAARQPAPFTEPLDDPVASTERDLPQQKGASHER